MEILADALLALLAAIGIWALGRLALERLFALSTKEQSVWLVVRAAGGGEGLEQTVRALSRLRSGPGVVLVDCGLDERGRALAEQLTKRVPGVSLCSQGGLDAWMKEAEAWTRQGSKMK